MNQHRKTHTPTDLDLKRNPGIGQSSRAIDQADNTFEENEGESTIEGDVLNDTEADGSVDPNRTGRTNH